MGTWHCRPPFCNVFSQFSLSIQFLGFHLCSVTEPDLLSYLAQDAWMTSVLAAGKRRLRSRRTPSASDKTPSAGAPLRHTDPRSALLPPNAASEWLLFPPACSASVASSCVRSVILTDERFLHFQLRQHRTRLLGPHTVSYTHLDVYKRQV